MVHLEPTAGEIWLRPVAQMTAGGQVQAQEPVARLGQGEEHRLVGLGTGMGLNIGVGGAEELLGPVDCRLFDHVDELAAPVEAVARIALQGLVCHGVAEGLEDGSADDVLRGDELDARLLAARLAGQGLTHQGIAVRQAKFAMCCHVTVSRAACGRRLQPS